MKVLIIACVALLAMSETLAGQGRGGTQIPTRTGATRSGTADSDSMPMRSVRRLLGLPPGTTDTVALVDWDRAWFSVPSLRFQREIPKEQETGYYSWRLDFVGGPGLSLVIVPDSMVRTSEVAEVIRASSVKRCADPSELDIRKCSLRLLDSVSRRGESIRLVIRDSLVMQYFHRYQPSEMWATVAMPGGMYRLNKFPVGYLPDSLMMRGGAAEKVRR